LEGKKIQENEKEGDTFPYSLPPGEPKRRTQSYPMKKEKKERHHLNMGEGQAEKKKEKEWRWSPWRAKKKKETEGEGNPRVGEKGKGEKEEKKVHSLPRLLVCREKKGGEEKATPRRRKGEYIPKGERRGGPDHRLLAKEGKGKGTHRAGYV